MISNETSYRLFDLLDEELPLPRLPCDERLPLELEPLELELRLPLLEDLLEDLVFAIQV